MFLKQVCTPRQSVFNRVEDIDWESCATVLAEEDKREILSNGW